MLKQYLLAVGLLMLGLSSAATLAEPSANKDLPEPSANKDLRGEQTRQWLELQKNGDAASSIPQNLSGPASANVYERYLNSFTHPIPEYFSESDSNPFNSSR